MTKTLKWIVLVWSVVGMIWNFADPELAWDVTLFALLYGGLVSGLMINDLKGK